MDRISAGMFVKLYGGDISVKLFSAAYTYFTKFCLLIKILLLRFCNLFLLFFSTSLLLYLLLFTLHVLIVLVGVREKHLGNRKTCYNYPK